MRGEGIALPGDDAGFALAQSLSAKGLIWAELTGQKLVVGHCSGSWSNIACCSQTCVLSWTNMGFDPLCSGRCYR